MQELRQAGRERNDMVGSWRAFADNQPKGISGAEGQNVSRFCQQQTEKLTIWSI
jgi:hypothetical protein